MQLRLYKTLWGHEGSFEQACRQAVEAGFDGIEGPAPLDSQQQQDWQVLLNQYQLRYSAEITTAGSYVPDRKATLEDHLLSLDEKLHASKALNPDFVNCLGGCDAWEEAVSLEFFEQAMQMAQGYELLISFETHRGRSFYNPWNCARICQHLPELKLTFDLSHWCVVTESLLEDQQELLDTLFQQAFHIHARVGYDQGAQVSDPRADRYQQTLQRHQYWWQKIWQSQQRRCFSYSSVTPEFGPDGYQAINAITNEPIGNLWDINCWMADQQRQHFSSFSSNPIGALNYD